MRPFLPSSPEQAQQHKEQVDEIEVKAERTDDRGFLERFALIGECRTDALDFLRVVRGQADKYGDARKGHYPVYHRRVQEDVDHRRDYQPDKKHDAEVADAREVGFRDMPVDSKLPCQLMLLLPDADNMHKYDNLFRRQ